MKRTVFSSLYYRVLIGLFCATFSLSCTSAPSMKVDYSGLGDKPIAKIIANEWMVAPEHNISKRIMEALDSDEITTERARSFGFSCVQEVISCKYIGHLAYRLSGVPAVNAAEARKQVEFIITIAAPKPLTIQTSVKKTSQ